MIKHRISEQQLLEGPITPVLIKLAIPLIIAFGFQTSYNFLDRFFVSKLGDVATAAIGMAFTVQLFIIAIGAGVGVGINSFIARSLGAGNKAAAEQTALHAFVLALGLGVSISLGGWLLQEFLFHAMGAEGQLLQYILDYLTIIFAFTPIVLLGMFTNNIFRGWGDTIYPMVFMVTGMGLNIVLDPLLIFGLGPFPALGIRGAAWATGISRSIALGLALLVMFGKHQPTRLSFKRLRFSTKITKGIFQVGLPSSLSQLLSSITMGLLFFFLKPFGEAAKAAYTIVFTYDMVAFLPVLGIAQSVTILTGHNFGAHKLKRVKAVLRSGIQTAVLLMGIVAALVFTFPVTFAGVFARSRAVLEITVQALRILSPGYIFYGFYLISTASFQGLGMGRQYLIANIARLYAFQVPLVFLLSLSIGLTGVWLGLLLGNALSAIATLWWYFYNFRTKIRLRSRD